jgi:hypothetical protein
MSFHAASVNQMSMPLTRSPLTESNRRPSPYHGDALPTELRGRGSRAYTQASRRLKPYPDGVVIARSAASTEGHAAVSGSIGS